MTNTQQKLHPPMAEKRPRIFRNHGDERIDDYYWLRERTDPDVLAYLEAENAYTEQEMAHTETLQSTLYTEMRARIQEADQTVPEEWGGYCYYERTEEGRQYPIHCRKRVGVDSGEEILLDENELATGHEYLRVGIFRVSPNHKLLAYSVDTSGAEAYTIYIKDLESGEHLPDQIPGTYYSVEWANDSRTLFYNVLDAAMRPFKLFRHQLGTESTADALIYHEEDEAFFLGLRKSKSQRYLFLNLGSKVTSEVWFIPADEPTARPTVISPRQQDVEYTVEHAVDPDGERFLITTNEDATNFRVLEIPIGPSADVPAKEKWRELIPHSDEVMIDGVEPFRNHLVIYQRAEGFRQIQIRNLRTGDLRRVDFPESVYTFSTSRNPDFESTILRFTYQSLTTPNSVYDYNMDDHTRTLRKQKEVLGGFDAANYASERLFANAKDGTQIPISLVRRKDVATDKAGPLLLYGYGSYGASTEPTFNSAMLSLLDRGVTFAIAHVRGGSEMGRSWYENGKFLHKKNTFTDFIACAEHLIELGYTKPAQLVAMGRSAGGLLMGAVTVMRPDLFRAIVAGVPFVDVINTMLDPSIPLTVIEYEEWGNPNDPIYYHYMKSYAPYENTLPGDYPAILATAGLNDPRVQYWEPAKWIAKLRTVQTNDSRLLLKTNMGAGHRGSSGRFDYLKEVAFDYAFLLDTLGFEE